MNKISYVTCPHCSKKFIDEGHAETVCPSCNNIFSPESVSPGIGRLRAAANVLILTAYLGIGLNLLWCVTGLMISRDLEVDNLSSNMSEEQLKSVQRGQDAAPLINVCMASFPLLTVYPLVIVGGYRMKQQKSYALCMTASIFVMLPCSLAFVLGIPVGIWSIVTLLNAEVKELFLDRVS